MFCGLSLVAVENVHCDIIPADTLDGVVLSYGGFLDVLASLAVRLD